jgi:hypothetical protein
MSHILYNELERFNPKFAIPYNKLNANKNWANHSYNLFVLKHIANSTTNMKEKIQANKEILIAQKKLSWWEKHPNFSLLTAKQNLKDWYKI